MIIFLGSSSSIISDLLLENGHFLVFTDRIIIEYIDHTILLKLLNVDTLYGRVKMFISKRRYFMYYYVHKVYIRYFKYKLYT